MPACNGSESSELFYLILAWSVGVLWFSFLLLPFLSLVVLARPNCQCHASSTWNPPATTAYIKWFCKLTHVLRRPSILLDERLKSNYTWKEVPHYSSSKVAGGK